MRMPRYARVVFPGVPHHVTQRGNNKQQVFYCRGDGVRYLDLLRGHAAKQGVEIIAYCLMPNHVHLVVVPAGPDSLHALLKPVHGQFAQRINRMRIQTGHLWQGRYFSSPLDPSYFVNAVRYVELNPVRAKLAARAEDYSWSSAAGHCGLTRDPIVGRIPPFQELPGVKDWSGWLAEGLPSEVLTDIRRNATQNLPCGSEEFIRHLEEVAGRQLRFRVPGRQPKPKLD
jgi:putative transposase